jgi:PHD/YefM family antitoxin component YafN of YafNO toxin-antitoxin module
LRRTRKPVLLTKNGKPEIMLIDARKLPKDQCQTAGAPD